MFTYGYEFFDTGYSENIFLNFQTWGFKISFLTALSIDHKLILII